MIEKPIGAALNRDIAQGEKVEVELDLFITRRDKERRLSEAERAGEELWAESVRRHDAARDAQLSAEWCEYHTAAVERHKANFAALVAYHEEQAQRYLPKGA